MEQKRRTRTWCGFLLLLVLLAVFLIWNLFAGSVQLSASQIGQILLGCEMSRMRPIESIAPMNAALISSAVQYHRLMW